MTDSMISRDGADSNSYQAQPTHNPKIDFAAGPRALMGDALIAEAPGSAEPGLTPLPVLTQSEIEANYRKVKLGAANTLVTIHPDGKRSYKHDVVNRGDDGMTDSLRTDRGEGTRDSLKLLREEGAVRVGGLLPKVARDSSGRFSK